MYKRTIMASISSAILTAVAMSVSQMSFLIWIALVPFFVMILNNRFSVKQYAVIFFVFGAMYYSLLVSWFFSLYPLDFAGLSNNMSIFVILIAYILVVVYEALLISIIGVMVGFCRADYLEKMLAIASAWVLIEYFQGIGMTGFTFGRLANSQSHNIIFLQGASLFGSLFVSALIIVVNGLISLSIISQKSTKKRIICLFMSAFVFLINLAYGYVSIGKEYVGNEINATVIQANIPSYEKWGSSSDEIFAKHINITKKAIKEHQETRLIIWSETAVPENISWYLDSFKKYQQLLTGGKYIISGGFDINASKDYNTLFGVNEKGEIVGKYYKQRLVPFGEYMPFASLLTKISPTLKDINMYTGDLAAGKTPMLIHTDYGDIGGLICFDSIFSNGARSQVKSGAGLLVLATNDSWFKASGGIYQHAGQAVLRAVEQRRYLLRSANTGVSMIIEPNGRIMSKTGVMKEDFLNENVKFLTQRSLYSYIGDLIVFFAIAYIIAMMYINRKMNL